MEHQRLIQLELDTLKNMYSNAAADLKKALLEGASWHEMKELRQDVTELEIALYKKIRSEDRHPAEYKNRDTGQNETQLS
ncbi:MAG: hypothetical protein JWP69_1315 [Flaviaesturariibacter sp.]|nr:hypothetical protein [Flaviaesturariibacter sp.]